jgi:hypothetical protein
LSIYCLSDSMRVAQKLSSIAELIRQEHVMGDMTGFTSHQLKRWNTMGTKYAALAGAGE